MAAAGVRADAPPIDLPDGFRSTIAAAPPLLRHPIMATLGGPGQLFVGDAAGTNLNKAGLQEQVPNRVVLLTDADGDGVYDRASVFADQMTFPQGGVWLDGSLYVASPPGIWRLTDTNADGVADQREMIVGGFEYTGNAADVHGPFLHPNGRLYWCHGRKGHEVKQKDGTLVHAGMASGIWSCRPDGSDVRWHALSCADNPTEIDFTPEGEILGTVNLYYAGPRGDTVIHWLRGGVYTREDQLSAIAGLPRTLETMPVVHNFGHVAVSGCAFYRSGALNPAWRGNLFVVHFNTQRVTRMELQPDGATYRLSEREFLKLHNADAHLTDVLEDRDGSLLVVDTGGWFRIGCPSSLMAKPDVAGAIYRIRKADPAKPVSVARWGSKSDQVWQLARAGSATAVNQLTRLLTDQEPEVAHAAANALATLGNAAAVPGLVRALRHSNPGVQLAAAHALGEMASLDESAVRGLLARLEGEMDPALEHQVMYALLHARQAAPLLESLRTAGPGRHPAFQRRALLIAGQNPETPLGAADVLPLFEAADPALAGTAARLLSQHRDWMPALAARFAGQLGQTDLTVDALARLETAVQPWLAEKSVRDLVVMLLASPVPAQQRTGWRILAASGSKAPDARWIAPLQQALTHATPGDLPLALDAVASLRAPELDGALNRLAEDTNGPLSLRLKAMSALIRPGAKLPSTSCQLLLKVLQDQPSPTARFEAARIFGVAALNREQMLQLAGVVPTLGPLELRQALRVVRSAPDAAVGNAFAAALAKAPALGTFQESEIRTLFSNLPAECYATIAPALRELAADEDARRKKLEILPAQIASQGRAAEGRKIFTEGKGACTTCHRIGSTGNSVGPDLSTIGRIRTPRDILESILFPSATIARDHEAHAIELADGQSLIAVIRRSLPDTLVVADASGQERTLSRAQIVSMQTLPTSLMPVGLDHAMTEPELLDLVAYLQTCK